MDLSNGDELKIAETTEEDKDKLINNKDTKDNKKAYNNDKGNNGDDELFYNKYTQENNEDNVNILMPSTTEESVEEQKNLVSADINGAISGKTVKKLILPEKTDIAKENYIFDFSEYESITIFQREALKALISPNDGTVALYLYNKSGITQYGVGEKYILERIMPLVKDNIFGNEVKIYKNYQIDEPVIEVTGKDITKMRINL